MQRSSAKFTIQGCFEASHLSQASAETLQSNKKTFSKHLSHDDKRRQEKIYEYEETEQVNETRTHIYVTVQSYSDTA